MKQERNLRTQSNNGSDMADVPFQHFARAFYVQQSRLAGRSHCILSICRDEAYGKSDGRWGNLNVTSRRMFCSKHSTGTGQTCEPCCEVVSIFAIAAGDGDRPKKRDLSSDSVPFLSWCFWMCLPGNPEILQRIRELLHTRCLPSSSPKRSTVAFKTYLAHCRCPDRTRYGKDTYEGTESGVRIKHDMSRG